MATGRHADMQHEIVGGASGGKDERGDGGAHGGVGDAEGVRVGVDVDGREGLAGGGGFARGGEG